MDQQLRASRKDLKMTASPCVNYGSLTDLSPQLVIVEAHGGPGRKGWLKQCLDEAAQRGARGFYLSCDFERVGLWAGVKQLLGSFVPEIKEKRPDLLDRHAVELVQVLPQLRRSLEVRSPSLTDMASDEEKVRNYAADRAFRALQGLIDLLDSWKNYACPDVLWIIACDDYDSAGTMSSRFFQELFRRRAERLKLQLLIGVAPGQGEKTRSLFRTSLPAKITSQDLPEESEPAIQPDEVARLAAEMESRVGNDRIEIQDNLPDLINLSRLAGRFDRVLRWRYFGLSFYCNLGYYADSLHYAKNLLPMALEHAPTEVRVQWWIVIKTLHALTATGDSKTAIKIAEEEGMKLVPKVTPLWHAQLLYLIAILYARVQQPRDFKKGEELLDEALAIIQQADVAEGERHFAAVFNRNGVAMIRSFQARHEEAMELCRSGIAELNAHLDPGKHRLHRSILQYNIAQVCAATGAYNEAIENLSAAMAMDPNYSEYYNERGNIFLRLGRLEEARADYMKAIDLSPPYFEVFTNLGQCYRRMGTMSEAIAAYSRALDLDPDHVLALLGRGKANEELNQAEAAIADYTAALARDSALWDALASRGVLHYQAGNLTASLADFDRAIALAPTNVDLYQNRATVLFDLGRHAEAVNDLRAALKLSPSEGDVMSIKARLEAALAQVA
jgi:tetratricopeptide (TPR) repeat protein